MVAAPTGTTLAVLLSAVAVAAVEGDVNITRNDLARRQAFEAAKPASTTMPSTSTQ